MSPQKLLQISLAVVGAAFLLIYPLAIVWPSGWAWHAGAPYESQYFMMIVGIYITLGAFLLNASRDPQSHRSLIWFTVWSSLVHACIMAVQSMPALTGYFGEPFPAPAWRAAFLENRAGQGGVS